MPWLFTSGIFADGALTGLTAFAFFVATDLVFNLNTWISGLLDNVKCIIQNKQLLYFTLNL